VDEREKILDAIHDHDRRLIRVETELKGLHTEVGGLASHITRLAEHVAELRGSSRWVFWIVTTGVPAIMALQIWDRLFP
jgi:hypothetical protein